MQPFGTTADGRAVHAVDISSEALSARILSYGAILNDVRLIGHGVPLTLGSPDLAAYEGPMASFGSLMGPVVNRIRGAEAEIDGRRYRFEANFEGAHTLHSGTAGTHHKVWEVTDVGAAHVEMRVSMPDGEGGFPGNRWVRVIYSVAGAALTMEIAAESDAPTLFSFANHSYWALDGAPGFAGHVLTIPAGRIAEPDAALMPTGQLLPVEATAYDARRGLALAGDERQFFDLNYCFCEGDRTLQEVARLTGRLGVTLRMESTAPGLQVYDCGTIDAVGFATHHGTAYGRYAGVALEAQRWPGAAHHAAFPRIAFKLGERFHQKTRWSFSA